MYQSLQKSLSLYEKFQTKGIPVVAVHWGHMGTSIYDVYEHHTLLFCDIPLLCQTKSTKIKIQTK
jgi:hypothetical protein